MEVIGVNIAEIMYNFHDGNKLPVEQKGCRKKSRGTKDQLLQIRQ